MRQYRRIARVVLTTAAGLTAITLAADNPAFQPRVEQWSVEEIVLHSARTHANPFGEVTLQCRFRSAGREVVADGLYDGDATWRVRLMPETRGQWTFATESNDPDLNGRGGSFEVGVPAAGNHGPVRVHDKYHFAYADGTPYFLMGTTFYAWLLGDADTEKRTLETLAHGPFNKVRFMLLPFAFGPPSDRNSPFIRGSNGKPDLDRFQTEYFARYERGIRELAALGIEADIILLHPYDPGPLRHRSGAHRELLPLRRLPIRCLSQRLVDSDE